MGISTKQTISNKKNNVLDTKQQTFPYNQIQ